MRFSSRRLLLICVCLMFTSAAHADLPSDLPDWPRPPTEDDCRSFQTAIEAYYQQAREEYIQCARAFSCTDAPFRTGAATARMSEVRACFWAALQASSSESAISLLEDDHDDSVAALGQTARKLSEAKAKMDELTDLGSRVLSYGKLSDPEKLDTNRDIAAMLNGALNQNQLSQQLTDDALDHVLVVQKDALKRLELELEQIEERHRQLIGLTNAASPIPPPTTEEPKSGGLGDRLAASQRNRGDASDLQTARRLLDESQANALQRKEAAISDDRAEEDQRREAFVKECRGASQNCSAHCNRSLSAIPTSIAACLNHCDAGYRVCYTSAYGNEDDLAKASIARERTRLALQIAVDNAERERQATIAARQRVQFPSSFSFPVFTPPPQPLLGGQTDCGPGPGACAIR